MGSGKCKFQCFISQLVKLQLTWNFEDPLVEHQSCYKQNFKFLAVQEPIFLKPKFGQNRPLTGFCMYIGPARLFFSLLEFDLGVMLGCFSDVFGLPYRLASLLIQCACLSTWVGTRLPSNDASKLIYCAKNYIRIGELAVFHFFYFCPCLPIFSIFVHVCPYCTNFFQKVWPNMEKNRDVPFLSYSRISDSITDAVISNYPVIFNYFCELDWFTCGLWWFRTRTPVHWINFLIDSISMCVLLLRSLLFHSFTLAIKLRFVLLNLLHDAVHHDFPFHALQWSLQTHVDLYARVANHF